MGENLINTKLRHLAERFAKGVVKRWPYDTVSIVLFGSVARGEAHSSSDIDLLIVMNFLPSGRLNRNRILEPVEDELEGELKDIRSKGIWSEFNYFL